MTTPDDRPAVARAIEQVENLLRVIPGKTAEQARDQLKEIRKILVEQRPPRLALVGRRGSGKSSLVNALFGELVAPVGHEKSQTGRPRWFSHASSRGQLELLDTRGLQESHTPAEADGAASPLESILDELERRCPDGVLFLVKAVDAGTALEEDLSQLKLLSDRMHAVHGVRPPIVAVLTQCDQVEPKHVALHRPEEAPDLHHEKEQRIRRLERQVADAIRDQKGLKDALAAVVGVCAYQSFGPLGERRADERWRVDTLVDYLCERLPKEAQLELARIARAKKAQHDIARTLTTVVASACAAVAWTPIPIGDIVPITSLQVSLIAAIGYVSGRTLEPATAAEFLAAMGANVGASFAMREAARATLKLVPVAGGVVSAAVAFAGTLALGEAAAAYFIDHQPRQALRRLRKTDRAG